MDAPSKNHGCHNYCNRYYSARLDGDKRKYRREHSSLGCDAVRSFWQPGEGVSKHCNRRRTLLEKYHKKFPCYWENQSGGRQKPQRSFQRENPGVQPTKADTKKKQPYREYVAISTSRDKQKKWNLRLITSKNYMLKRFRSEKSISYDYKSKLVKPCTALASGWARGAANDLRALILSKRAYHNSKAGGAASAKKFKNGYDAEHNSITSEAMLKHFRPEKSISDDYKSKPVKPCIAVASGSARGAANDLRALILSKRAYHNSKAGGAASAKKFKNGYDAEHNSITSKAMFQTRKRRLESDYSFKEHRVVSGTKVTLILNGKVESNNNGDTLTGPVRVRRTRIKTCAEIRVENNSTVDSTSSCSALKKASRVSDCLPQKLSCKNTEATHNLRSASHGNKFRMPVSNPDEKDRLQKTEETTPDSKFTPRKSQLKRENRDAASGPAPKRSRSIRITFNSLEESKVIVQGPGSNTNNAHLDLSKTKGTSCLSTKSANYMLNEKGDNNALNPLSVSQTGKGGIDIYEELLTGDDEDNDTLLGTDENILQEIDDVQID